MKHPGTAALVMLVLFAFSQASAQRATLSGSVSFVDGDDRIAQVMIPALGKVTFTDDHGDFILSGLPAGLHRLVITAIGFRSHVQSVVLAEDNPLNLVIELNPDPLQLHEAVISGTRNLVDASESTVHVSRINAETFQQTQSLSLAEGLAFSPGLRVETNCQNCGFTQVRMNGLDGAYSQILINSRPVFSSLAGVYGLELLPANMIERIEVVRGGGSSLYGGNAIAGTINIITKDPDANGVNVMYNQAFTNLEAPDRTFTANASIVSEDKNAGMSIFGYNRVRAPWDANDDGFSELTQLRNTTFGLDAFYKPTDRSRISLNAFTLSEFRRGGSDFDRVPHQSQLTEQLDHDITGAGLSFEQFSRNFKHKFSAYTSVQWVDRASYYGGGGRVLDEDDELTEDDRRALNAYGQSDDITVASGLQYTVELGQRLTLTSGGEWLLNEVADRMPGYQRAIDQRVRTLGTYSQLEARPIKHLTLLAGARVDLVEIVGSYITAGESLDQQRSLNEVVPRLAAMYEITQRLRFRAGYAQGYRGPQAFDEDLHISTVGGDALFIVLSDDLKTERSESYTASFNYSHTTGSTQVNYVVEAFHTRLRNPFMVSGQEDLPNGTAIITKRNAGGAVVRGVNLEANAALNRRWLIRSGLTLQQGLYDDDEVLWEDVSDLGLEPTSTSVLLRMPRSFGYLSATYTSRKGFNGTLSSVYTGSMRVPHVIDPSTEYTVIKKTPEFFEVNLRVAYSLESATLMNAEVFAGVHNLMNSYQRDFDTGPERDANYVYGPMRPRTIFFGCRFGF